MRHFLHNQGLSFLYRLPIKLATVSTSQPHSTVHLRGFRGRCLSIIRRKILRPKESLVLLEKSLNLSRCVPGMSEKDKEEASGGRLRQPSGGAVSRFYLACMALFAF